jgi:hypothetical protein
VILRMMPSPRSIVLVLHPPPLCRDQHRREAFQVGIERRDPRVLPIHFGGEVGIGQFVEITLVNERIDGVLALKAGEQAEATSVEDARDAGFGDAELGGDVLLGAPASAR